MNRRKAITVMAVTPLALGASKHVEAGGFAVVYLLGELPNAITEMPMRIRFVVLGHDMIDHLWCGFDCEIRLTPTQGGEDVVFTVPAKSTEFDKAGGFETEITVPDAGEYEWSIRPGSWEATDFPTLTVHARASD